MQRRSRYVDGMTTLHCLLHWCRNFIYDVTLLYLNSIRYKFLTLAYSSSLHIWQRNIKFTTSNPISTRDKRTHPLKKFKVRVVLAHDYWIIILLECQHIMAAAHQRSSVLRPASQPKRSALNLWSTDEDRMSNVPVFLFSSDSTH
jgi:hypothetical protein